MKPALSPWLLASLALHALVALAIVLTVERSRELPMLLVDLTAPDVTSAPDAGKKGTGSAQRPGDGSSGASAPIPVAAARRATGAGSGGRATARVAFQARAAFPPSQSGRRDAPAESPRDVARPEPRGDGERLTASPRDPERAVAPGRVESPATAVVASMAPALVLRATVDASIASDPVSEPNGGGVPNGDAGVRRGNGGIDGNGGDGGAGNGGRDGRGGARRGARGGAGAASAGSNGAGALALAAGAPPAGEADYARYLGEVRTRIQQALRYPLAARRRSLSGTVHVEIVVQPTGRIAESSIVESSSHRVLDDAALDAVRAMPPLPFPPGVVPRALRARLPVVFELR